jgi:hypothetical protein
LDTEGIYRVSGVYQQIQNFKRQAQQGVDIDLSTAQDVYTVAGVLTAYLRDLPEPLIPYALFEPFFATSTIENRDAKRRALQSLIRSLPSSNKAVIQALLRHLNRVAQHSDRNKMSAVNLGIVFGPSFMHRRDESLDTIARDGPVISGLMQMLIDGSDYFFGTGDATPNTSIVISTTSQKSEEATPPKLNRLSSSSSVGSPSQKAAAFEKQLSVMLLDVTSLFFDKKTMFAGYLGGRMIPEPQVKHCEMERRALVARMDVLALEEKENNSRLPQKSASPVVSAAPVSSSTRESRESKKPSHIHTSSSSSLLAIPSPTNNSPVVAHDGGDDEFLRDPLRVSLERLHDERSKTSRPFEMSLMSIDQLRSEKAAIKKELRKFDRLYVERHGREPGKAEKEPLRPLYQRYKLLKQKLEGHGIMDDDDPHSPPTHKQSSSALSSGALVTSTAPPEEKVKSWLKPETKKYGSAPSLSRETEHAPVSSAPITSSASSRQPRSAWDAVPSNPPSTAPVVPVLVLAPSNAGSNAPSAGVSAGKREVVSSLRQKDDELLREFVSLRSEKRTLQRQLHEYQDEFQKRYGRKVQYRADRFPMEKEYERYKFLRARVQEMEELLQQRGVSIP